MKHNLQRRVVDLFVIALVVFFPRQSLSVPQSFPNLGYQTVQEIWTQLRYYGLLEMNAWDVTLPRPQVPALRAVVSVRNGLLAYYDEETGFGGSTLVFKNPNGGLRHSVSFNRETIQFTTPYQGNVAHANGFMTVNGPGYHFYCQSRPVTEAAFYRCIEQRFVRLIVDQLRRYTH